MFLVIKESDMDEMSLNVKAMIGAEDILNG
jgi:hypothetical protein